MSAAWIYSCMVLLSNTWRTVAKLLGIMTMNVNNSWGWYIQCYGSNINPYSQTYMLDSVSTQYLMYYLFQGNKLMKNNYYFS